MSSEASTAAAIPKREQPPWTVPQNANPPKQLFLYNSLTRKKERFEPINGKTVKWYICGPTVYDSSHMGHARAYLSFDILRRVMQDYFGYHVQFVMNITDIDDKIIRRARQRHLLTAYLDEQKEGIPMEKVLKDVVAALKHFGEKYRAEKDEDKRSMMDKMMEKVQKESAGLEKALKEGDSDISERAKGTLLNEARDVLSDWLDHQKGDSVNDKGVFDHLAKTYENEFFADMARLNVLPPDVLTRVSEYVPEVVKFVERIIANGYAYATKDGSVYFDTAKFSENPKHFYAKLVPEAYGDIDPEQLLKNMREGEGELSIGADVMQQKRNANDFALWKTWKAGEPFWESPWGKGRPGWHIECSAMCSEVCGAGLDIHAGGSDLRFPHHDNEIAQCEAHFESERWVNYFLHAGTLRIQGLKMSKSLKNFITIRDALRKHTSRQMRILFLMHAWTDALDFCDGAMDRALHFERITNEFLSLVKHILRKHYRPDSSQGYQKMSPHELEVQEAFNRLRGEFHAALCDSVDTKTALDKLRDLVKIGNAYIDEKEKAGNVPNTVLLRSIAVYITAQLRMFGAIPTHTEIGFPLEQDDSVNGEGASGSGGANLEETVMPYLEALAKFRENVRNHAKQHGIKDILEECDRLRDDVLPELGVRLEDRTGQTVLKLADKETLRMEAEQKRKAEAAKAAEKEKRLREQAEKAAAKEAQRRVDPAEMFKQGENQGKYSQYDEKGVPTHTADGKEVSKKQKKNLADMYEKQKKAYADYTAEQQLKAKEQSNGN